MKLLTILAVIFAITTKSFAHDGSCEAKLNPGVTITCLVLIIMEIVVYVAMILKIKRQNKEVMELRNPNQYNKNLLPIYDEVKPKGQKKEENENEYDLADTLLKNHNI